MHHALYFSNLFSALDIMRDFYKQHGIGEDIDRLVRNGFTGTEDYEYAREFRNAIVHRGLDPTAAGHADDDFIYVLCPPIIQNQSQTRSFACSVKYTIELATRCNRVIDPVILKYLEDNNFFVRIQPVTKDDLLDAFCSSTVPPDWAKAMAAQAFDELHVDHVLAAIAQARARHIRQLLQNSSE